jgi:hypothetical protein
MNDSIKTQMSEIFRLERELWTQLQGVRTSDQPVEVKSTLDNYLLHSIGNLQQARIFLENRQKSTPQPAA